VKLQDNGRIYPIRITDIDFPKDKYSRHFSVSYYIQKLFNGMERTNRKKEQFYENIENEVMKPPHE